MREKVGEELMEAVRTGDAAAVSKVCANGDAEATYADEFGFSCLHLAAKRGNDDVVRVCMWGDMRSVGACVGGWCLCVVGRLAYEFMHTYMQLHDRDRDRHTYTHEDMHVHTHANAHT